MNNEIAICNDVINTLFGLADNDKLTANEQEACAGGALLGVFVMRLGDLVQDNRDKTISDLGVQIAQIFLGIEKDVMDSAGQSHALLAAKLNESSRQDDEAGG